MAGICGLFNGNNAPVDVALLNNMAESIAYRGPDGIHAKVFGAVGFAYLAMHTTPQATEETQPLFSQDGRYCLVADACLGRRASLVTALQAMGQPVTITTPDSQLILTAWLCWAEKTPAQLYGVFAFVLWDSHERRLFAAVDALSHRSLFYAQVGETFVFGTDAAAVLAYPYMPKGVYWPALARYAEYDWDDTQSQTLFEGVHQFLPAQKAVIDADGLWFSEYEAYDLTQRIRYHDHEQYAEHFRTVLMESVTDAVTANPPLVGISVSGGLDSTTVAVLAQHIGQNNGRPTVKAYSRSYPNHPSADETAYSNALRDECGIDLTYVPTDGMASLPIPPQGLIPHSMLVGVADSEMSAIFQETCKAGGRVLLTGSGGDEIFPRFYGFYLNRLLHGHSSALRRLPKEAMAAKIPLRFALYAALVHPLVPDRLSQWRAHQRYGSTLGNTAWSSQVFMGLLKNHNNQPTGIFSSIKNRYAESLRHRLYIQGAPRSVDLAAAWYGIEMRHPLLDRRVVAFLLAIPPEILVHFGLSKPLLRAAMAGFLPEKIRMRGGAKTNFNTAQISFLRERGQPEARSLMAESRLVKAGMADEEKAKKMMEKFFAGEDGFYLPFIRFLHLEIWLKFVAHAGIL
jgi:asparagine synthase (glutamine-hydrolysing)